MKKKIIPIIIITVLIAGGALYLLQMLMMPKYMTKYKEGTMVAEYYSQAGSNDVIFLGDCEVYENISPITLWEDYGVTSFIRGSSQQLMWHSYYILKETLKYEKPKLVVFNILAMMYGSNEATGDQASREAYNRMTLDGMRWSPEKWQCINAAMTREEREKGGITSYIFPLLRYHSRWNDLSTEDFDYLFRKDQVTDSGYLMQVGVKPVTADYPRPPLVNSQFADICYDYLDKIVDLCRENDIEIMFMKAPSLSPIWYDEWEQQIVDYAAEKGIYYINFLNCQEKIGIDWDKDTYDSGLHLNVYGAEKLADYLGNIITERYGLTDHRNDSEIAAIWDKKAADYKARKTAMEAEYASRNAE